MKTHSEQDASLAFLKEVDEALQYERLLMLWHRYRWVLLAGVVLLVLVVAGLQGWRTWQLHQARAQAERWYNLMSLSADTTRRAELAKFLPEATGGYRVLGAFQQAEMIKSPREKSKSYQLIADDTSLPSWVRDLARFNMALTLLGVDDAQAKAQLELLTQQNNAGPLMPLALEQLAILALRQGDRITARGYTEKLLAQPMLTEDLRQRALQRLGQLSTITH